MNQGTLYLVATPIGNLEDISFRAIKVLKMCECILAEDTRVSVRLLEKYNIVSKMVSYHKFNEKKRCDYAISLLQKGKNVSLISDAGTPSISDPGNILVSLAIEKRIKICPIPGATAFVSAIVASGFCTKEFYFAGFVQKFSKQMCEINVPIIFYESPYRIKKFLDKLKENFGNRKIVIAREITKIYETFYRGMLDDFLEEKQKITYKGEFVVIIEGHKKQDIDSNVIKKKLLSAIASGLSKKEAVIMVSKELSLNKNRVYDLSLIL